MNTKEFEKNYFSYYLLLEKDFRNTFDYVSVEEENYDTYSSIYLKILLSIGSEVDIMKKYLAKLIKTDFDGKKDNVNLIILNNDENFKDLEVRFFENNSIIKPWDYPKEPDWWTAYNEIKHNRIESAVSFDKEKKYYQYANLKNVLYSLSGLYSLEMYVYRMIATVSNEELFVPVQKTLFCMNNSYWSDIQHGGGVILSKGKLILSN